MVTPIYGYNPDGQLFLCENDTVHNREEFERIFFELVSPNRLGADVLLDWLANKTDFYVAPCSTVYHLSITGGLCLHSLKVYEIFDQLCDLYYPDFPAESRAVCALLHDICKANVYKPALKSRKTGEYWSNGKAKWEDYMAFDFDDPFPYGHGEKSVYLSMRCMPVTDEEAMAIRWHMGGYDSSAKSDTRTLGNATTKYPVISLLHAADLIATSQGF